MRPIGVLLVVAGLVMAGLGLAGRIRAAQLLGLPRSGNPFKSGNVIYQARRLYEMPDHGLYIRNLLRSSDRLLVAGASLALLGVVLIF